MLRHSRAALLSGEGLTALYLKLKGRNDTNIKCKIFTQFNRGCTNVILNSCMVHRRYT